MQLQGQKERGDEQPHAEQEQPVHERQVADREPRRIGLAVQLGELPAQVLAVDLAGALQAVELGVDQGAELGRRGRHAAEQSLGPQLDQEGEREEQGSDQERDSTQVLHGSTTARAGPCTGARRRRARS